MPHGFATTLQVIIGSGVGAGAVTFFLNFWKAEWDFRRAKLEELYAAIHRHTISAFEICSNVTIGKSLDERKQEEVKIDFERLAKANIAVSSGVSGVGKSSRGSPKYVG